MTSTLLTRRVIGATLAGAVAMTGLASTGIAGAQTTALSAQSHSETGSDVFDADAFSPVREALADAVTIKEVTVHEDTGLTDVTWVVDPGKAARAFQMAPQAGLTMIGLPHGVDFPGLSITRVSADGKTSVPVVSIGGNSVPKNGAVPMPGLDLDKMGTDQFRNLVEDVLVKAGAEGVLPKMNADQVHAQLESMLIGRGMTADDPLDPGSVNDRLARPSTIVGYTPGDTFEVKATGIPGLADYDDKVILDTLRGDLTAMPPAINAAPVAATGARSADTARGTDRAAGDGLVGPMKMPQSGKTPALTLTDLVSWWPDSPLKDAVMKITRDIDTTIQGWMQDAAKQNPETAKTVDDALGKAINDVKIQRVGAKEGVKPSPVLPLGVLTPPDNGATGPDVSSGAQSTSSAQSGGSTAQDSGVDLDELSFNDAMKVYDAVNKALAERERTEAVPYGQSQSPQDRAVDNAASTTVLSQDSLPQNQSQRNQQAGSQTQQNQSQSQQSGSQSRGQQSNAQGTSQNRIQAQGSDQSGSTSGTTSRSTSGSNGRSGTTTTNEVNGTSITRTTASDAPSDDKAEDMADTKKKEPKPGTETLSGPVGEKTSSQSTRSVNNQAGGESLPETGADGSTLGLGLVATLLGIAGGGVAIAARRGQARADNVG